MATVMISGVGRGVGRAMAERFVARGDRVLGSVRDENQAPEGVIPVLLDVTDATSVEALAARLEGEALDLLVCNAGALVGRGGIEDPAYTFDAFAEVLAVNVTGVFMTVRAALPAVRRGEGKIAVISSQMGSSERAKGNAYLYRASKAAATNLAMSMAVELKPEGIAVGAYHPGWVRTDMGGSAADISVDESADGLLARFDELDIARTGCFDFYSGEPIPF